MSQTGVPAAGEAHIWHVPIDLHAPVDDTLLGRLAAAERERATRHGSAEARARYATARAALRGILATYAGCEPHALELRTAAGGKPELVNTGTIHFSVSHARDGALIAVCTVPVGVDVEHVRPPHRLERTAARLLHQETAALLGTLTGERRMLTFFEAWTQREAHVKAVGGGLFRTPDTLPFQPQLEPDRPQPVLDRMTNERWTVARLMCAADMRAALAAQGPIDSIVNFQWSEAGS